MDDQPTIKRQLSLLLPKDHLDGSIWDDDDTLYKEIRAALLRIASEFFVFLDVDVLIKDVIFTGSLANYNYTKHSDIDLHIVLDFSEIDENDGLVKNYMLAKKSLWNDRHEITVKGFEVELYAQDGFEHHSTGVYSILRNMWLKKPTIKDAEIDVSGVVKKTRIIMDEIDRALKSPNRIVTLGRLKDKIVKMRQSGLESSGEFSSENLSFKILRKNGYLEKLFKTRADDYDESLSLQQESIFKI